VGVAIYGIERRNLELLVTRFIYSYYLLDFDGGMIDGWRLEFKHVDYDQLAVVAVLSSC
jgi:hypothetical protein